MQTKQHIAVLGFGNPVRSDDAVGPYVIEKLQEQQDQYENLTLMDMGTAAFEILFQLNGKNKLILVDGVINSGDEVGSIFKLPAEEINASIQEDPMVFLHSMKWDQALSYAKKIMQDKYPTDIEVYLIAIENIKLEVQMSDLVKEAGDKVVNYILKDIEMNKK